MSRKLDVNALIKEIEAEKRKDNSFAIGSVILKSDARKFLSSDAVNLPRITDISQLISDPSEMISSDRQTVTYSHPTPLHMYKDANEDEEYLNKKLDGTRKYISNIFRTQIENMTGEEGVPILTDSIKLIKYSIADIYCSCKYISSGRVKFFSCTLPEKMLEEIL